MSTRVRVIVGAVVLIALVGGALFVNLPLLRVRGAYGLVDETTLTVHQPEVQVQRPGEAFITVTGDVPVRLGDRIRTGPEGYATVTYFDGSTTTLDPGTDIILRRLDKLPDGGAQISFHQEAGRTWNRVQHLVDANSRFEGTTASAVAFVRGTEFILTVTGDGRTIVEAVSETTFVEANGVTVELPPGFLTTVTQGQAPATPVPAPPARFGFRIDVQGPAQPFLVDNVNRSAGFQPDTGIYGSQIPGAKLTAGDGSVSLLVPNPVSRYELLITAVGNGGAYTVTITSLENGQPVAGRPPGLARPLANQEQLSGNIGAGKRQGTSFEFRDGQILNLRRPMSDGSAIPDGSHMLFARSLTAGNPDVIRTAIAEGTLVARGTPTAGRMAAAAVTGSPTSAPATGTAATLVTLTAPTGTAPAVTATPANTATRTLTPPLGSTATPTPPAAAPSAATVANDVNGAGDPATTPTSIPIISPTPTATPGETPEETTPTPTGTSVPPTSTSAPTVGTPVATVPLPTDVPSPTTAPATQSPIVPPPPATGFFGFSQGGGTAPGAAPPPAGAPNPGPQPAAGPAGSNPVMSSNTPNIPQLVVRSGGSGGPTPVPTQRPLQTLETLTIQGDYVAAGVGLRGATSGTINISGIPAGSTIRRAYLLWGMLDNGESPSLRTLSFNGTPITGVNIGSGPDTCWDRGSSHAYRANVTALVSGNGAYALTGVASGANILAEGASLVVIYENPAEPSRFVQLLEGNLVLSIRVNRPAAASMQLTGFTAGSAPQARSTFIVGDGQPFSDNAAFDGGLAAITLQNPFDASDGQYWDTKTINVSSSLAPGATSATVSITTDEDCLMWVGQAFSVAAATGGTGPTATPTVPGANVPTPTPTPPSGSVATATPPATAGTGTPSITVTATTTGSAIVSLTPGTVTVSTTATATVTPTATASPTPTLTPSVTRTGTPIGVVIGILVGSTPAPASSSAPSSARPPAPAVPPPTAP